MKDEKGHGSEGRGGSIRDNIAAQNQWAGRKLVAADLGIPAHQTGVNAATKPNSKVESYKGISSLQRGERMNVKEFQDRTAMHEFLNKGSNSLSWREHTAGLNSGTYARAGGQWHNVKSLDPSVLAHI